MTRETWAATIPIVDTHFHLSDLDENYYPWLSDGDRPSLIKDFSSLRRNYLVTDLLRDIGGLNVIAGVHVQAEHDRSDVVRDTLAATDRRRAPASRGFPHAIVADADFASPEIERLLEAHRAFRNTRESGTRCTGGSMRPNRMIR